MGKISAVVEHYEQHIEFSREIREESLRVRILVGGLRALCKQLLSGGWIILSYDWLDTDGLAGAHRPDAEWHEYIIFASVLNVGEKRARDASFRRSLRKRFRNHAFGRIIFNQ